MHRHEQARARAAGHPRTRLRRPVAWAAAAGCCAQPIARGRLNPDIDHDAGTGLGENEYTHGPGGYPRRRSRR